MDGHTYLAGSQTNTSAYRPYSETGTGSWKELVIVCLRI